MTSDAQRRPGRGGVLVDRPTGTTTSEPYQPRAWLALERDRLLDPLARSRAALVLAADESIAPEDRLAYVRRHLRRVCADLAAIADDHDVA